MDKNKYLLIKGGSGLGNRMLALLCGLEYARLSGRQPVVDWRDGMYADAGEEAFLQIFEKTEKLGELDQLPEGAQVVPAVWQSRLASKATLVLWGLEDDGKFRMNRVQKILDQICRKVIRRPLAFSPPWDYRRVCVDLKKLDLPEAVAVFFAPTEKFFRLRKHYRKTNDPNARLATHEIVKKVFEEHVRLPAGIMDVLEQFRKEMFKEKMIGIHVRYTDRKGSLEGSLKDVEKVRRKYPDYGLYLATDSEYVEKLLKEKYPDLVTLPKRFAPEGKALHLDKTCDDRVTMTHEAMKEMLLLAACDALVYTGRSTFSFMARSLSGLPRNRVVNVDRNNWVNNWMLFLHKVC
jgi:hypothetical protein